MRRPAKCVSLGPVGLPPCRHRVPGPGERHQEGITLRSTSCPFSLDERVTEEPLVFRQDLRLPTVTKALEERTRALDVGEEEDDRPG